MPPPASRSEQPRPPRLTPRGEARGKGVPSPLLGVASHRPHRHVVWKIVASFPIGNLHAKARIKSNVAVAEKYSVSEQKFEKETFAGSCLKTVDSQEHSGRKSLHRLCSGQNRSEHRPPLMLSLTEDRLDCMCRIILVSITCFDR